MPDVLTEVRRRRGPFTRVVIVLVVAWWVLGLVRMVLAVVGGLHPLEAAARHGQDLVSVPVVLVLLLFAVADVWVRPRLENAVRLTSVATWVSSLAVGTSIAAGVAGLWSPALKITDRALEIADIVVSSVVPVLLCVVLGTVAGAARRAGATEATRTQPEKSAAATGRGQGAGAEPAPAGSGESGEDGAAAAALQPLREPDAAAGAAWHSAADAAHGQQAAAWGDTTTPFGWEPVGQVPEDGTLRPDQSAPSTNGTTGKPGLGPGQIDPDLWRTPHGDPQ